MEEDVLIEEEEVVEPVFEYGQIIEYADGTFDTIFNKARRWCMDNNATLDELVDERNEGMRYFKINEVVIPQPEIQELTIEQQNAIIRATREKLYRTSSDYLKADYDEAVARGADNIEELKKAWLESKDKIREENPYIGGDDNGLQGQKTEVVDIID